MMKKLIKITLCFLFCIVLLSFSACTGKNGEQNETEAPATETTNVSPSPTMIPNAGPTDEPTEAPTPEPTAMPTEAPTPKATKDPYDGFSQKTRDFTEEEAIINAAYHALFPDRDDYIAYWKANERIFWGPEGIEDGYYYDTCRYEWIELDGMYAFVYEDLRWTVKPTDMYVAFVRPDGTISSIVYHDYETDLEYRTFTLGDGFYLAISSGLLEQGQSWNSCIIDLKNEKIAWNERDWYENNDGRGPDWSGRDKHKLLITDDGFTVYEAEVTVFATGTLIEYKEVGFLSFAELLG